MEEIKLPEKLPEPAQEETKDKTKKLNRITLFSSLFCLFLLVAMAFVFGYAYQAEKELNSVAEQCNVLIDKNWKACTENGAILKEYFDKNSSNLTEVLQKINISVKNMS